MYSIELQTVFYEYQNKNHKIDTSFVSPGLRPLAADKTGFNLKIFHFDIRGKLSIIRCDKYILIWGNIKLEGWRGPTFCYMKYKKII